MTENQSDSRAADAWAVSARGLARVFGNVVALDHVSLDIRKGEFFSLLGPSGCGKTTLLRIIAGFEEPSAGTLQISGDYVLGIPPYHRRTNLVFQHGALFPHLNVAQNVAFGLQMKKVDRHSIARRVDEALELVRLAGYGSRRIDQISGGQRQRIALARALINEPDVLLLDEPLSALDLQLRLHMQEELRSIQRATGKTFVFVTHDQGEAMAMSDRLAVLQGGRILQVGTPREVYETPSCRFVAEFMGHSNLLFGTVASLADGLATVHCPQLRITGRAAEGLAVGQAAMVALRYEKLILTPARGTESAVSGTVMEETYLGSVIRRRVTLPGDITLVAEMPNSGLGKELENGAHVDVGWNADAASILPA